MEKIEYNEYLLDILYSKDENIVESYLKEGKISVEEVAEIPLRLLCEGMTNVDKLNVPYLKLNLIFINLKKFIPHENIFLLAKVLCTKFNYTINEDIEKTLFTPINTYNFKLKDNQIKYIEDIKKYFPLTYEKYRKNIC